ncbi:unnamed protein product, partial [Meganyctiphanes norvegica]
MSVGELPRVWVWVYSQVWVVVVVARLARAFCPYGCQCDEAVPSARCVGASMGVVPILLNPSMRTLNLANNAITSIAQAFVFYDQLEQMDLSQNDIKSLGTGNFDAQGRLRELKLAHNNISELLPGSFHGLGELSLLDLSYNSVREIPVTLFTDVPELTVLLLEHNRLHALPQHTFRSLSFLHHINLCDNYFRHVPSQALEDLSSLKTIHLCRNRLTTLEENAFPNKALSSLYLESNSISIISDTAFHYLQKLKKLNLEDNLLRGIPSPALSSLLQLEFLSLNKNNLTNITNGAFLSMGRLARLEVSWCPELRLLHPQILDHCVNLHTFKLSHNPQLVELPTNLLVSVPRLRVLDLSFNSLKGLLESAVPVHTLTQLDVRGNPLVCNCSLLWLASLLATPNASIITPDLQCQHPPKLRGVYLSR